MTAHAQIPLPDEFDALVNAACNGALSQEDAARLEALLQGNVEAQERYLTEMCLDRWLRWEFARHVESPELASATEKPWLSFSTPVFHAIGDAIGNTVGYFSSGWPLAYAITTAVFAIALVVGGVTKVSTSTPTADLYSASDEKNPFMQEQLSDAQVSDVRKILHDRASQRLFFVGRITGEADCKWRLENREQRTEQVAATPHSPISNLQSPVAFGDHLTVAAGLLEITFDTGAKVILEGPCTFNVETNGGFLAVGRLTGRLDKTGRLGDKETGSVTTPTLSAKPESESPRLPVSPSPSLASSNPQSPIPNPQSPISKPQSPFVIATPMALITDLGTEFGVAVAQNGAVDTRVFEGRVRVSTIGKNQKDIVATQELNCSEAVHIAFNDRMIQRVNGRSQRFVRRLPQMNVTGKTVVRQLNVEHNFLTSGVKGTIWSGILNADKASRIDTLPVLIDGKLQSGLLTIGVPKDALVGWASPHRDREWNNAPYLYVDWPEGDFEAQVQIKSQTIGYFSVAGLMARLKDGNFASIQFEHFDKDTHNFVTRSSWRNTDANSYTQAVPDKNIALRLVRIGDAFLAYGSSDNGDTWIPLDWDKGDNSLGGTLLHMPNATGPVQLGLWYGTFNPTPGQASFHNFIIKRTDP